MPRALPLADTLATQLTRSLGVSFSLFRPFRDRVSCISGWPQTCSVAKNDPEFLTLPVSTARVLELQLCATATKPGPVVLGMKPQLGACQESALPTELHLQPTLPVLCPVLKGSLLGFAEPWSSKASKPWYTAPSSGRTSRTLTSSLRKV